MFKLTLLLVLTMVVFTSSQDSDTFLDRKLNEDYGSRPPSPPSKFSKDPAGPLSSNSWPEKLSASWLLRPPFMTLTNLSGSNGSGDQTRGIFRDVLDRALSKCCSILSGGNKAFIDYKAQAAANISLLHQDILKGEADLILPVQSDDDRYKSYLPYLKILESPGIVLIQRTDSFQRWDGKNILLWNAISSCWPIVVLTLLLSFAAGMCVWAMETTENPQEFGSPFYGGVFDGFWWAFVTMSTVGYGDKTPKSIIARLFAVVWIMVGITICSILTATLSSALTSVTVERYDVLAGMKIGAARDSIAIQKALNLGVNLTAFEDLDEVHQALVDGQSVDGMMEEMFTAIEYLKQRKKSKLSIVHLFEEKHGYGIAFKQTVTNKFGNRMWGCISKVVNYTVTNGIYDVTNKYINGFKSFTQHQSTADEQLPKTYNVIDQKSPVFIGTVIGFGGMTLAFFTINLALKWFRARRLHKQSQDVETGQGQGENSHENSLPPWAGKRLEFTVTELAKGPFALQKERSHKSQDKCEPNYTVS